MKRYDVTVVGTAATVSILKVARMPEAGRSTPVYGDGFLSYANGGMGFNICAGLASVGLSVYPVLTYADSRQREFLHTFAEANGMPQDGLKDPPPDAAGTTIMIQDDSKCHMTLITGYEHRLPDSTYYGVQKMEQHFFTDSRIVVLTAPMAMNTQPAIDAIRESGVPLALSMRKDPNALPPEKLRQILPLSELVFANEAESLHLMEVFGMENVEELFRFEKLRHLIVTLGAKGSCVYSRTADGISAVCVPAVQPHCAEPETVGAGDGFVSGFLLGYLEDRSIVQCAQLGSVFSSFVLEKEGSVTNLPTRAQLLARLDEINAKGV